MKKYITLYSEEPRWFLALDHFLIWEVPDDTKLYQGKCFEVVEADDVLEAAYRAEYLRNAKNEKVEDDEERPSANNNFIITIKNPGGKDMVFK